MFKIATIMHNVIHQRSQPHLKDLVTFCVNDFQRLSVAQERSSGDVLFCCEPRDVWNSLPATIIDDRAAFRRVLSLRRIFLALLLVLNL